MAAGCFEHFQVCICSGLGDSQRRHSNAIEVQTAMKVIAVIKMQGLFGSDILRSKGIVLKRSFPKKKNKNSSGSTASCALLSDEEIPPYPPAPRSTACRSFSCHPDNV